MAKILIWPDIYKEHGHWLPTTTLAKALRARNHTVEYMGIRDCEKIATDYGFTYHRVLEDTYPLGYTLENDLEPKDGRWKPHHLFPIARGQGGFSELLSVGSDHRPDLVVSGYFTALETLLLHYKYDRIPFVIITTYLRHPDDNPYIRAQTQLIHMLRHVSNRLMDLVNPPTSLPGQEPKENTIREFVTPLRQSDEMIPCPKVFDFQHYQHGTKTKYVEPMITTVPDEIPEDAELPDIPEGTRVIYGTAGSMVEDYGSNAGDFFRKLIDMMSTTGMDEWHLILSVGEKLYKDLKNHGKKNVSVYSWLSQAQALDLADVCFTHGGLATVKEAIYYGVPVVAVPQGKDQMDNALRVKRSKVGVISNAGKLTAEKLKLSLTEVVSSPWITDSLGKMKEIFEVEESTTPRPSVGIIESVIADT